MWSFSKILRLNQYNIFLIFRTEVENKSPTQLFAHANKGEKNHSESCDISILTADDSTLDDDDGPMGQHISKDINTHSLKVWNFTNVNKSLSEVTKCINLYSCNKVCRSLHESLV